MIRRQRKFQKNRFRELGSIKKRKSPVNKSTVLLDSLAMTSLADRLKKIQVQKAKKEEMAVTEHTMEELEKMIHVEGKTHVGKTYQELWEKEPGYCSWVIGRNHQNGTWPKFNYFLKLKIEQEEKELGIETEEDKGKKVDINQFAAKGSDSPGDSGWSQVEEEKAERLSKQEMMMEQMYMAINGISQRLHDLEVVTQEVIRNQK